MVTLVRCLLWILLTAGTAVGATWLVKEVLVPGWTAPTNRTYTSRLGRAALMRERGEPFPVRTARIERRRIDEVHLGEGLVQSTPVLVPVIPMARVANVHVEEGDLVQKGDLLAVMDTEKAEVKVRSALAALASARAELERVRIGSSQTTVAERPEQDAVRLEALEREATLKAEILDAYTELSEMGLVSKNQVLEKELEQVAASGEQQVLTRRIEAAEIGRQESVSAAASLALEAEHALELRQLELSDYEIRSPATGVVERVLIHEGEFNQDPGRPAFLVASGAWFEAHVDQTSIDGVREGDAVDVFLEAHPGRELSGVVTKVLRFVTFDAGGPEAARPIRPLGTGAPEWPATFRVRVAVDAPDVTIVPGLTGFARIKTEREAVVVPRAALVSVSASRALVYVVDGAGWSVQTVLIGASTGPWVEVKDGVREGDVVAVDGHRVLEPGDAIRVLSDG